MQAHEAAQIFHDWAEAEGMLPEGPLAAKASTAQDRAKIGPITEGGKQILRSRQVRAVAINDPGREITVFLRRAPPKRQVALLPQQVDDVVIKYRQGVQEPIAGPPLSTPHGAIYAMRSSGGADRYTCGSSISVGNAREAGTLGCLVRDAAQTLYGLSNNHVSGSCSHAPAGLPILAPGVLDVLPANIPPFTLGFHHMSLPMVPGTADNVNPALNRDAAIFRIHDENRVSSYQRSVYDTPAATSPIVAGQRVEKVGRTTGHTVGAIIGELFGHHGITYSVSHHNFGGVVYYTPLYGIVGLGDAFSDGGDSGSLITTVDAQGNRTAVGLVVGGMADSGAPGGRVTVALAIEPILQQLRVTLVSGLNV